ncbi:MAG: hypothetical protein MZV64_16715 [Ignavibacteriales bacterium]|nr:hypothetical protein [Ignavibacteriales bacterium]
MNRGKSVPRLRTPESRPPPPVPEAGRPPGRNQEPRQQVRPNRGLSHRDRRAARLPDRSPDPDLRRGGLRRLCPGPFGREPLLQRRLSPHALRRRPDLVRDPSRPGPR